MSTVIELFHTPEPFLSICSNDHRLFIFFCPHFTDDETEARRGSDLLKVVLLADGRVSN